MGRRRESRLGRGADVTFGGGRRGTQTPPRKQPGLLRFSPQSPRGGGSTRGPPHGCPQATAPAPLSLPPQRLLRPHLCAPRSGPCAGPAGAVRGRDPGLPWGRRPLQPPPSSGCSGSQKDALQEGWGLGSGGYFWGSACPPLTSQSERGRGADVPSEAAAHPQTSGLMRPTRGHRDSDPREKQKGGG